MYNYGYGAPPPPYSVYPAPYGAPPAPYGAQQPPYGAPPAPYGAPPAPYGAPPAPYGTPPAPYGAPPAPYGAPAPYSSGPPAPHGTAPPRPSAPAPSNQAPPGDSHQSAQQQPQAQASSSIYPSLTAPPPSQTVPTEGAYQPGAAAAHRPVSAYPSTSGAASGRHEAPNSQTRPASAQPTPSASYGYGAPSVPAPAPQQPTAPYTYGQPAPGAITPAVAPARPYMPPTTYAPAPGHGTRRRRALLVGCSYPGTSAALNGCLNDVQCIQFCLQQRFGFTEQQFVVLRDDPGRHHDYTSTKANIYKGIQWLMMDQQPGDSLFFHFSGHGSQQYDRGGDEEDGYDETICPADFRVAGQLVDDELNRMMVRPLMPGVTLHAVIDACHSGTALDLPYRAKVDSGGRWYWKGRPRYDKCTAGGTVFQFGACKDSQTAQDTKALSGRAYTGAATFCFIDAIEKYGIQQTYGQVLSHMMTALRAATGAPGLGSTGSLIANLLLGGGFSGGGGQTPVLSCDKQVDLYATRLSL